MSGGDFGEPVDESGLAATGIALDQHESRHSCLCRGQGSAENGELAFSAEQQVTKCHPTTVTPGSPRVSFSARTSSGRSTVVPRSGACFGTKKVTMAPSTAMPAKT